MPQSIEATSLYASALSCITKEAEYHDTFWQIASMGTTPPTQDPDAGIHGNKDHCPARCSLQPKVSMKGCTSFSSYQLYLIMCSQNQIFGQNLSKAPLLLQLHNQIITDQETRGFTERVNPYCEKGLVH